MPTPSQDPARAFTTSERRTLQDRYLRALQLRSGNRLAVEESLRLLQSCVEADPGNLLYVQATIDTAEQLRAVRWKFVLGMRRWLVARQVARVKDDPRAVLKLSPQVAEVAMDEPVTLLHVARAAAAADLSVIASLYARAAKIAARSDAKLLAEVAAVMRLLGQFDDASEVSQLREATSSIASESKSRDDYVREAGELTEAHRYDEAQQLLAEAQAAHGGDLLLMETMENVLLARARQRLKLARDQHAGAPSEATQKLVDELEADLAREEIRVFGGRIERSRADRSNHLQLGSALVRSGSHRQAIGYLEKAMESPQLRGEAATLLGESLQSIRKFDDAVAAYRQAIAASEASDDALKIDAAGTWVRCRYRAAVLLAAMGQGAEAKQLLREVVAAQPTYKAAAGHLDKLASI